MSVRRTHCPRCNGTRMEVIAEHEPETTALNMRVTLKCTGRWDCGHEWEDTVMSHHARREREAGRLRV